jgi:hypothetical protein
VCERVGLLEPFSVADSQRLIELLHGLGWGLEVAGDQRWPPVEAAGQDGALLAVREPEAVQRLDGSDVDVLHARGALEASRL